MTSNSLQTRSTTPSQRVLFMEIRESLRELLPEFLKVELEFASKDSFLKIEAEDGSSIRFQLLAASSANALKLLGLKKSEVEASQTVPADRDAQPLLVSRYLSLPIRQTLTRQGLAFADATGNARILNQSPSLAIITQGGASDPFRAPGRPKLSLKGQSAQQVAKYLVEHTAPLAISKLIQETGVPRGSVYRVLDLLAESDRIEKSSGQITRIDWEAILLDWTDETSFFQAGFTKSYQATKGLPQLLSDLKKVRTRYVATGTIASAPFHQSAGLYAATLYSEDPDALAKELGLVATESGANVIIAFPSDQMPYLGEIEINGLKITSPALTFRDLMSGPGRGPEEAKNLLDWMRSNRELWQN
jgi:hypothetical protein